MFSHMPGLCDETETMGPRAANSSFMTDNIYALSNQVSQSVMFWKGNKSPKAQKVILCHHFIMHHHHAKITAMNLLEN